MFDYQEALNKAYKGIVEQGCQSVELAKSGGITGCVYLSEDGNKCAVGHLISEDKYLKAFEGTAMPPEINDDCNRPGTVRAILKAIDASEGDLEFLSRLQSCHDMANPGESFLEEFVSNVKRLVSDFKLEMPEL